MTGRTAYRNRLAAVEARAPEMFRAEAPAPQPRPEVVHARDMLGGHERNLCGAPWNGTARHWSEATCGRCLLIIRRRSGR